MLELPYPREPVNLTDIETCYKAFRWEAFASDSSGETRFGFELEITLGIVKRRLRVDVVAQFIAGERMTKARKLV